MLTNAKRLANIPGQMEWLNVTGTFGGGVQQVATRLAPANFIVSSSQIPVYNPSSQRSTFDGYEENWTEYEHDPMPSRLEREFWLPVYRTVLPPPTPEEKLTAQKHLASFLGVPHQPSELGKVQLASESAQFFVDEMHRLGPMVYVRHERTGKQFLYDVLRYRLAASDQMTEELLSKAKDVYQKLTRYRSAYAFLRSLVLTRNINDIVLCIETLHYFLDRVHGLDIFFGQFAGEQQEFYKRGKGTRGFMFEVQVMDLLRKLEEKGIIRVVSLGQKFVLDDDYEQEVDWVIDLLHEDPEKVIRIFGEAKAGRVKKFISQGQGDRYIRLAQGRGIPMLMHRKAFAHLRSGKAMVGEVEVHCFRYSALLAHDLDVNPFDALFMDLNDMPNSNKPKRPRSKKSEAA